MKDSKRIYYWGLLVFSFFIFQFSPLYAQEINCHVTVNSDKIEGSNKQVFETLQKSVEDYINTTKWTNMTFADMERIECNMMIIVSGVSDNEYTCEMTLQSRRPVYGTSYTTPVLNIRDKYFNFTYQEFDRLDYQQSTFTTNLTAMLAYYCYLVIGFDLATYSRMGGQGCFDACESIVQTCQSASMTEHEQQAWLAYDRSSGNKNRYAIISNLNDAAFKPFREYIYEYHRLGLDQMSANVANGRARIAEGIDVLVKANQARPATYIVTIFLDAKADELADIFHGGTDREKKDVYEALMRIDPTRQNTYDRINEK